MVRIRVVRSVYLPADVGSVVLRMVRWSSLLGMYLSSC